MRWIKNLNDPTIVGPLVMLGLFPAGSVATPLEGDLLERTNSTNTKWVPIDSDHDAAAGDGLAIANYPIGASDLGGYHEIVVPRPGDVFEADLASASAIAPETALYYSSATALATSGSNIIAYSVEGPNHPGQQDRVSKGEIGDQGTTFRSTSKVWFAFRAACSIYKTAAQKA